MGDLVRVTTKLPAWREPKGLEEAKNRIGVLFRSVHENAYQLGKTLLWVKEAVDHGQFIPWLEKNVSRTVRSCQYAMDYAERCDAADVLIDIAKTKNEKFSHLTSPPLPPGKFRVLYADPPWAYRNTGLNQSAAEQYPTLETEDICLLAPDGRPISDLAGDDAVLFLWVTAPNMPEGLKVLESWGFEHVENMVWKKSRAPGMGWWLSVIHEWLLIGRRGQPGLPRERPVSVFESPVGNHSQKPALVYSIIESMFPGPYIELFARQDRAGWTSWGNEIPLPSLPASFSSP